MEIYEELGMLQIEPDYPSDSQDLPIVVIIIMEE